MNPLGNVREVNLENLVEHEGVVTRANNDEHSGMCPVRISRIIADTDSLISATNSEKDANRVCKSTNKVKKLHNKPILFLYYLKH